MIPGGRRVQIRRDEVTKELPYLAVLGGPLGVTVAMSALLQTLGCSVLEATINSVVDQPHLEFALCCCRCFEAA